jgi:hypothetical protein
MVGRHSAASSEPSHDRVTAPAKRGRHTSRMLRHPVLLLLLGAYVLWGAYGWFQNRSISAPDGVLASGDPQQVDIEDGGTERIKNWTLKTRAHYRVTARVLGIERYSFDALAGLIPEDLALGWGPMSDNNVLREVNVSQSNRFYYWKAAQGIPLPRETIISHSANTHVIPGDVLVARELAHLHPGQLVTLTGELVDAVRDDGASIRTSMVRTDTGAGACEVLLVRDVTLTPYH